MIGAAAAGVKYRAMDKVGSPAGKPTLSTDVEVAGIEPASSVASTGLLRAQCALPLLGPSGHAHQPLRRAQSLFDVPSEAATAADGKSPS